MSINRNNPIYCNKELRQVDSLLISLAFFDDENVVICVSANAALVAFYQFIQSSKVLLLFEGACDVIKLSFKLAHQKSRL